MSELPLLDSELERLRQGNPERIGFRLAAEVDRLRAEVKRLLDSLVALTEAYDELEAKYQYLSPDHK